MSYQFETKAQLFSDGTMLCHLAAIEGSPALDVCVLQGLVRVYSEDNAQTTAMNDATIVSLFKSVLPFDSISSTQVGHRASAQEILLNCQTYMVCHDNRPNDYYTCIKVRLPGNKFDPIYINVKSGNRVYEVEEIYKKGPESGHWKRAPLPLNVYRVVSTYGTDQ